MTDMSEWEQEQKDFLTKIGQVEKPATKSKKDEE
jgi:hypothetical protein